MGDRYHFAEDNHQQKAAEEIIGCFIDAPVSDINIHCLW